MPREKPSVPLSPLDEIMVRQFARPEEALLLRNYLRCHFGPRIYQLGAKAAWMRRKRAKGSTGAL